MRRLLEWLAVAVGARAPGLHRSRWHSGCYVFWHMIDPKVITEILKANGVTSRSAPGSPLSDLTGLPFWDPSEIPAGSAGEALFLRPSPSFEYHALQHEAREPMKGSPPTRDGAS
jgi:hypothetical protein